MRALPLLLVALLLAGCSSSPGPAPAPQPDPVLVGGPAPEPAPPLPPVELYNGTLGFQPIMAGLPASETGTVAAGYLNVTVTITAEAQCPSGYLRAAAIGVDAGAGETLVPLPVTLFLDGMPVQDVGGYSPYGCSPADTVSPQFAAETVTAVLPMAGTSWTVRAAGEFTGLARVVLTATP